MRSPWPGLLLCRWVALWPSQSPGQLRGQLVDVELIAQFSGRDVVELLVGFLPEDIPSVFAQLIAGSNYDITALRVVYQTVDAAGEPDFASGLVVLPTADDLSRPPPIVVYHHGTLASDADVPSNLGAEALVGYILATDGYIAVLPDYLGFGVNAIPHHPYVHRRTQATASIDLLRAARQGLRRIRATFSDQVFLVGYSQGGHAAVSTMAEIEARHMSEFNLVLTAAGSGPYNLSGVQQRYVLDNPQYPAATFLPLGLLGWEPIYPDWFDDLPEVFLPPYDVLMPQLFDRTNTLSEIQRHLPRRWVDFMQPEFVQDLESNPLSPVAAAFRDNDLLSFRPRTPLTMYYCTEDELVSYFNTVAAWFFYKVIAQSPADEIAAVNLGPWGHVDTCLVLYALFAKRQLDAERNR